jgi:S1-C subfamily serine protease
MKHSFLAAPFRVFRVFRGPSLRRAQARRQTQSACPAAQTAADLAETIRPSLVKITQLGREGTDGIGSGFIVSADGLIATNLHVIGEARRLQIEMHDGKTHATSSKCMRATTT